MLKRRLKEPFGKAGLTVAIFALVMALIGGAYAAGGLTKSQEKQVTKIAKKYAGKPGAVGATGAAGAPGKDGINGANGTNGNPGAGGKSVVATAAGGECPTPNGTTYEVEGSGIKHPVCNGKNGTTGFTKTLPSEETETGTWATVVGAKEGGFNGVAGVAPISTSFAIPLAAPLSPTGCNTAQSAACHVHLIAEDGEELVPNGEDEPEEVAQRNPAPCPGSAGAPEVEPGNLCIYIDSGQSAIVLFGGTEGAFSTAGGVALPKQILGVVPGSPLSGSWAVAAP